MCLVHTIISIIIIIIHPSWLVHDYLEYSLNALTRSQIGNHFGLHIIQMYWCDPQELTTCYKRHTYLELFVIQVDIKGYSYLREYSKKFYASVSCDLMTSKNFTALLERYLQECSGLQHCMHYTMSEVHPRSRNDRQ